MSDAQRRRRIRRREFARWENLVSYCNSDIAQPSDTLLLSVASVTDLVTRQVASLDSGAVVMFLQYDPTDMRVRAVDYTNTTDLPAYLEISVLGSEPTRFNMLKNHTNSTSLPSDAWPLIDAANMSMGYAEPS